MSFQNQETEWKERFKKVRRIKTTQSTDRGVLFTKKNCNDGFVEYESLTEEGLCFLLDHDPNCIYFESQPIKIPSKSNKAAYYIPDYAAYFIEGKIYIFDVKHHKYLDKLAKSPKEEEWWKNRIKTIREYCEEKGWDYQVVTDIEIRTERLDNVQFFMKNKREPEFLLQIQTIIKELLDTKDKIPRIELAIEISKISKLDVKQVIPVIDHLVFWNLFLLDFEKRIDDNTELMFRSKKFPKLKKVYQYLSSIKNSEVKPNSPKLTPSQKDPNYDDTNQREFLALPEHLQKEVLHRLDLLKVFNKDYNTYEIKKFALKNNVSVATLYNWKNLYEPLGWVGLIPNHGKKGREKVLGSELEKLIQDVINERYLTRIQPSIEGCFRFLQIECKNRKIKPPSFSTFYRRVREISPSRKTLGRRGKKILRDEYKGLEGEYPFGIHPLDTVEFDHTILDIMLVDRIDRKPIGRPVLTLAFDVYSRMIYGYYMSFDSPSYLTVAMCFLMGIKPKDEITNHYNTENKWVIYGLPKTILLDNAKEFRGTALFNFCKLYNIDMRINPVHRPDLKPYVERVFKTINESIKDDFIGGYIIPLDERRKTQYDPEKSAEMTIEEFERWFVHWIVDNYHKRVHTGLKQKEGIEICPSDRFEQGLVESRGRTVGLPSVPSNLDQLSFDALPFKKRGLNRNGIRIFGLEYNAPIIANLRATQKNIKEKHIIKYDPRDIREIYLWAESMGRHYNIPLKKVYHSMFKINPDNPLDHPLSKKELEILKKNRKEKAPMKQYDLLKSKEKRQEMIEEARKKTKTAKKSRKIEEVRKVHKSKATSTTIRNTSSSKNMLKDKKIEEEIDINIIKERLKKQRFETKAFPRKSLGGG